MSSDPKVLIRPAKRDDIPAITDIYNHAIVATTATFDIEPKSTTDRLAWFKSHGARHPVLVLETDDQVRGWACITEWSDREAYNDTAEGALYVDPEYHNRGYGQLLNTAITETARELGFHTLIARVTGNSDVSIHLCKKYGYQYIGTMKEVGRKFDQLLDVHLFQKML